MAALVTWGLRSARPTPEKIVAQLTATPLGSVPQNERDKAMIRVANQMNALEFEQRRELQQTPELRGFFTELTDEEKSRFLDLTLPEGFRQMMQAFNKMEPDRRKRLVDRVIADLEENGPRNGPPGTEVWEEEARGKIVNQGLQAFYSDASAEVKLDFAPVLEKLQESLQSMR